MPARTRFSLNRRRPVRDRLRTVRALGCAVSLPSGMVRVGATDPRPRRSCAPALPRRGRKPRQRLHPWLAAAHGDSLRSQPAIFWSCRRPKMVRARFAPAAKRRSPNVARPWRGLLRDGVVSARHSSDRAGLAGCASAVTERSEGQVRRQRFRCCQSAGNPSRSARTFGCSVSSAANRSPQWVSGETTFNSTSIITACA